MKEAGPEPNNDAVSLAVQCVRGLMERHGRPRHRQSPWLAEALGISYSQAHRRLNGTSPWHLEDLARVAKLFGETLAELVGSGGAEGLRGTIRIGPTSFRCHMWLGNVITNATNDSLVAISTTAGWIAVPNRDIGPETTAYEVDRLEFRPAMDSR